VCEFVTQGGIEDFTLPQEVEWLEFDLVFARGRGGPGWHAGASDEVAGGGVEDEIEIGEAGVEVCFCDALEKVVSIAFEEIEDVLSVGRGDCWRVAHAEVRAPLRHRLGVRPFGKDSEDKDQN
jgi:hypothetical protein